MKSLVLVVALLLGNLAHADMTLTCKNAVGDHYRFNPFSVKSVNVLFEGAKYSVIQYELGSALGDSALFEAAVDAKTCQILKTTYVSTSED